MRRRVLFLTSSYPEPDFAALGIFVKEHARAVARHAEVAVVHLDRSERVRRIHCDEVHGEEFPTWRVRYPARPAPLSYVGERARRARRLPPRAQGGFRPARPARALLPRGHPGCRSSAG